MPFKWTDAARSNNAWNPPLEMLAVFAEPVSHSPVP